jgi:hypothetical protein
MRKKLFITLLLVLMLLLGLAVSAAPGFLVYADKPTKSDAVVLFLGEDFISREKEARLLLRDGYAQLMIVPVYHQAFSLSSPIRYAGAKGAPVSSSMDGYPGYYEKTHIEILEAKKMMKDRGLDSAIMVSSPYHMKRIKMICENTFGEQARGLSYVPTRFENAPTSARRLQWKNWVFVAREYVKICWFRMYSTII